MNSREQVLMGIVRVKIYLDSCSASRALLLWFISRVHHDTRGENVQAVHLTYMVGSFYHVIFSVNRLTLLFCKTERLHFTITMHAQEIDEFQLMAQATCSQPNSISTFPHPEAKIELWNFFLKL